MVLINKYISQEIYTRLTFLFFTILVILSVSCKKSEIVDAQSHGANLIKIRLQTDWLAQPEHGGFYQALTNGYYKEVGLDVEILQGGPNAMISQKVALGRVEFAINSSDNVLIHASNGMPLLIVGSSMQHVPQAIMVHAENKADSISDLHGKTLKAAPSMNWIPFIEKKLKIKLNIIPHDFGIEEFLYDKKLAQQCYLTNEPYYVSKRGVKVKTFLISDYGYDPYSVIYTNKKFAEQNPEIVRKFVNASNRGWHDYLEGDSVEADKIISALNPKMTSDFVNYIKRKIIEFHLVDGFEKRGESIGQIQKSRIEKEINQLKKLNLIKGELTIHDVVVN